jgi:NTP pyrophosphatase (non-canonical NTP hydrolase)
MREIQYTMSKDPNTVHFQKLQTVKNIKELTGLGLKEAKELVDKCDLEKFVIFSIPEHQKHLIENFNGTGYIVKLYPARELKLNRVLFEDQELLIKTMLQKMGSWQDIITEEEGSNLTFNQCKEIAVQRIYDKYEEYIKVEKFLKIYNEIREINASESKPLEMKFLKFNEEFGEMAAEYIKYTGYSSKPYDEEHLIEEMSDTFQVLMSIFSQIERELNIPINTVLDSVLAKNIKWKNHIKFYTK